MVDDQFAKWPKWLKCYCGTGRAWWQAEQRRYMCNTGCGVSMIPDINLTAVSNGIYRLGQKRARPTRPLQQRRHRVVAQAPMTAINVLALINLAAAVAGLTIIMWWAGWE